MDGKDACMYYHDDVIKEIDLSLVLNTKEVCLLGIAMAKSWEAFVTELPKIPWAIPRLWNSKD